jgi:hypothetical protein
MLQRWSPEGEVFVGALRRWPMIPDKGFFPAAVGVSWKLLMETAEGCL